MKCIQYHYRYVTIIQHARHGVLTEPTIVHRALGVVKGAALCLLYDAPTRAAATRGQLNKEQFSADTSL